MKTLVVALLSLLFLPLITTGAQAEFQKSKIAVLDFRLQGNNFETDDMGKIVAEWLITAFVREGRFEVIERKLLGEVLEEQKMVEAGIVNQETASKIGELLGVKVIISGSVMKIGDVVEVNARIVDVASASIITAESVKSSRVSSLHELVNEMAAKIIKNFPLEGYIAYRKGKDVVIDLGRQSGVKVGMFFLVYREGDVVKHPKTGDVLFVSKIKTGIIKITSIQEKIAQGVILDETKSDIISYGNLVKSSKNGRFVKLGPEGSGSDSSPVVSPQESSSAKSLYQAQGAGSDGPAIEANMGQLFIDTVPVNARVRILNIVPKYYDGITLPAGNYNVEVSARGYKPFSNWYLLDQGESKRITIELTAYQGKLSSPPSTPGLQKYFDQLWSKNSSKTRQAAKYLYQKHKKKHEVIDVAHVVLAARFHERSRDSEHVDAMAYLCNILGESRQPRHRNLLQKVSGKAASRKLRSYALKNMRRLPR